MITREELKDFHRSHAALWAQEWPLTALKQEYFDSFYPEEYEDDLPFQQEIKDILEI